MLVTKCQAGIVHKVAAGAAKAWMISVVRSAYWTTRRYTAVVAAVPPSEAILDLLGQIISHAATTWQNDNMRCLWRSANNAKGAALI